MTEMTAHPLVGQQATVYRRPPAPPTPEVVRVVAVLSGWLAVRMDTTPDVTVWMPTDTVHALVVKEG